MAMSKDARGQNTKINYGMDTTGEKEKRTSKKNVDGRSTSSLDNKKLRTRSMEKQTGMAFGFRKTPTAVKKKWIDRVVVHMFSTLFQVTQGCLQYIVHQDTKVFKGLTDRRFNCL
jgi:hypothetical protein